MNIPILPHFKNLGKDFLQPSLDLHHILQR